MGMSRGPHRNTLSTTWVASVALDPATVARLNMQAPITEGFSMLELTLPTMTCGHCVGAVTKAIQLVDPQAQVEIDLASHRVRVQTTETRDRIVAAVGEAGYVPA